MTLIYILSEYEEHGAENVVATSDPSKLAELFDENWRGASFAVEVRHNISLVLEKDDLDIINKEGWECSEGWGGIQLHVVELD